MVHKAGKKWNMVKNVVKKIILLQILRIFCKKKTKISIQMIRFSMHDDTFESHSLQLQVERVLSICRRLDPDSLFLRNKLY